MSKYQTKLDMNNDNSMSLILKNITPKARVLEMGPATGYMTQYMKEELRCDIVCVEIDKIAAENASKYCNKIIISDINDREWVSELVNAEKFDFIIWADVIEHLLHPERAVAYSMDLLKETGKVIISTPNILHNSIVMEMLEGKFNYQRLGLLDETHLRFFTKDSLLRLLELNKLKVIKWLNTIVKPEDTEFHQHYSNFSPEIREYLENRGTGEIYQFIVVCEKESYGERKQVDFPNPKVRTSSIPMQIYWSGNQTFDEANSFRINLNKAEDSTINIKEKISCSHFRCLRIDPGDFPCLLILKKMNLEVEELETGSTFTYDMGIIKERNPYSIDKNGSLIFFLNNNDPQIIMNLENEINGAIEINLDMELVCFDKTKEILNSFHLLMKEEQVIKKDLLSQLNDLKSFGEKLKSEILITKSQARKLEEDKVRLFSKCEDLKRHTEEVQKTIVHQDVLIKDLTQKLESETHLRTLMQNSLSWKLTRPLRFLKRLLRGE